MAATNERTCEQAVRRGDRLSGPAGAATAVLELLQGWNEFLPGPSSEHPRIVGPTPPSGSDPGAAFTPIQQIGTNAAPPKRLWCSELASVFFVLALRQAGVLGAP